VSFLAHSAVVSKDHAYALNIQDTLKVSGAQVSPVEIENCLLDHPGKLINDVTVAGVSGGRITDEKVPRAWVVLTPTGKKCGVAAVVRELSIWHQKNLSKYKWLRGGIQIVDQVSLFFSFLRFVFVFLPHFLHIIHSPDFLFVIAY
jgi:acyl-CoA synthetase (AMP-forming)/AMP-acid ligase II